MTETEPFLTVKGLCKEYPGVVALGDVSLEVHAGELVALVGKNGAGKSTLIKVLAGAVRPDSGEVLLEGQRIELSSPKDAAPLGLAFVHQELADVPKLTVAENVLLGSGLPRRFGKLVDWKASAERAEEALAELDPAIDPRAPVESLSVAQRRMVMIAQALVRDARLLVLDEPTAALSVSEIDHLHEVVRKLAARGVAVIYVSHRLGEVFALTPRTIVMRDGRVVADAPTSDYDRETLISVISGRDPADEALEANAAPLAERTPRAESELGPVALEAKGITSSDVVRDVSFEVRSGEVLGIAGLVGAGRTELLRLLVGADRRSAGEILVRGEPVRMRSPQEAARHGVVLLPEDRRGQGLIVDATLRENLTVTHLEEYRRRPRLASTSRLREREGARAQVSALSIKARSVESPVGQLSGGNQQKVVLGKWLARGADVFIFDEPTAGIDVDGRGDLYQKLDQLAEAGKAVIVVSSDFSEFRGLCDRVLVMSEGRLTKEISGEEISERALVEACYTQ